MDFSALDAAVAKLGTDVHDQIEAAKAAILAAQGGDLTHLAEVVAALNTIDAVVLAATEEFKSPAA